MAEAEHLKSPVSKEKILRLAADLLDVAAARFSNDVCADWDFPRDWSEAERQLLVHWGEIYNGTPEEYDPAREPYLNQWCVMYYCAELCRRMATSVNGDP